MYTSEDFDREKTRVLKYILYKKRTEQEIRNKYSQTIEENLLEDIIEYLKEAQYINDMDYIEKTVNNFKVLKNLSIREIQYKLASKGLNKSDIEEYMYEKRDPKSNMSFWKDKSLEFKRNYLDLYLKYSNYLYLYLIKKLNLKKFDDMLLNNKYEFKEIDKKDMDLLKKQSN